MNERKVKNEKKKRRKTNQEIRQRDESLNDKPLKAITKKSHEGGHEQNHPQWKIQKGDPRTPTQSFTHIRGHGEIAELHLGYPKHRFQVVGVGGEVKVRTRECLNPYGCHQYHPFSGLPTSHLISLSLSVVGFVDFATSASV